MGFYHGIKTSEVATSIKPAITTSNLPVIIGTAPVNLADEPQVNKPVLLYNMKEVSQYFGYTSDIENYTLNEAAKVFFQLYGMAPVCFINVLDPDNADHKSTVTAQAIEVNDNTKQAIAKIPGIIKDTVVVHNNSGTNYILDEDYKISYDSDGYLTVSFIDGGALLTDGSWTLNGVQEIDGTLNIWLDFEKLEPSQVDADDIIGGYDDVNDKYSGLELIDQVFSYYRKVPTMILAPKYGEDVAVAAVMDTKADKINSVFRAISIVDIPETVTKYSDVPDTKNLNNLMNDNQIVCWPKVKLGDDVYRLSLQVAGLMMSVDYGNNDVPKESPSNKQLKINGTVVKDGSGYKDIILDLTQANYLNENGIMTAMNFANGWTAWGNRTACYPANTDPKDSFIPAKRIMQYYDNSFILTYWVDVDKPTTKRLVESIIDSRNEFYNGEVAAENLLAGKIEFQTDENPITDLLNGKIQFHNYITPPLPAEQIISTIELDTNGYDNLF